MFEDLNGVWLLTAGGMVFAFLGVLLRYAFKSKCDKIDLCCGLIKIHRNVDAETEIELARIENGVAPDDDAIPNSDKSDAVEGGLAGGSLFGNKLKTKKAEPTVHS